MYLNLGLMKLFLKQMTNEKFEWSEVILYSMEVVISASDKYMLHKNFTKDWNTVHYVHIHTEHASTGPGVSSVLLKLREWNFHRRCADFFCKLCHHEYWTVVLHKEGWCFFKWLLD